MFSDTWDKLSSSIDVREIIIIMKTFTINYFQIGKISANNLIKVLLKLKFKLFVK
jgi:hypothetical protein